MHRFNVRAIWYTSFLPLIFGAAGCSGPGLSSASQSVAASARFPLQGYVHGGEQPVVGAAIQIYAAGTPASGGGYGQGSTPLITGTLPVTDVNGNFSISGDYALPPTPSFLYIVATGGSPGNGLPVNPEIALMATLGGCTAASALDPSEYVDIDEVTTASSVLALQGLIAAPAAGNVGAPAVGASAADYNTLQNGFETVNNLVQTSTGMIATPGNDWAASESNGLLINTLADILVSCVNSDPSSTDDCSTLFSDATPSGAPFAAADTLQAAWYIAQNPTNQVGALFGLVSPTPAFVGLSTAPAGYAVSVATSASACQAPVALGTAANFDVLAASTVTNAGPTTVSGGDLGLSPGTSVTGFPPGAVIAPATTIVNGAAVQAQADLAVAYAYAAGLPGAALLPVDLSGLTLPPGLYATTVAASLGGSLTLDAQGDANAVFIFQIGSALTTGASTEIVLANGAQAANVFWEIGSSATLLGPNSVFAGTVMASASITLDTGATLQGRALALNAAVTLDSNTITAP
jgi:hypothetical protein